MGLMILSKDIEDRSELLKNIFLASVYSYCSFSIDAYESEKVLKDDIINVVIKKKYENCDEYMIMGLDSKKEVKSFNMYSDIFIDDEKYYRLSITDDANYDHIIYDFSLEYVRLNPNHCISLYGETFFFLQDMERLESEGGYYKDWCFKKQ